MRKPIILIGYFAEAVELCEKAHYQIVGIVDSEQPVGCSYDYIGDDAYLLSNSEKYAPIPLFLIPDAPGVRKKLYNLYRQKGFHFATVISPTAIISKSAHIGTGCMIQDGCNISSNVKLGICVRVNSLANIMHDSEVGDFSTIAPSGVILGKCKLENSVYIGANATILPGRSVRLGGVVGAGAVVTKNVNERVTVAGVPAKQLQKK